MNVASTVASPTENDMPEPSSAVFHPTMLYPVLVKDWDGRMIDDPIVILFNGSGVVPCVFSMLNDSLYPMTVHFGYKVATPFAPKHPLMISAVMVRDPGSMSMPLPSEEVFQTVA